MSASLAGLSASVTRILSLTGFPKELKTKDIQSAFSEWENVNGGFKIKWRDDTSLLIVFQDATVAKRAYLHTIANPPPILTSEVGITATIKPYDGPDAQNVIQNVNSRGQHNSNPSRSHNARSNSISVFSGAGSQGKIPGGNGNGIIGSSNSVASFRNGNISIPEHPILNGRGPSPTLPSLPTHPTLNSLINSSLSEGAIHSDGVVQADPAIVAISLQDGTGAPRIGNPGKRMLGAALGVRHPSLGPRIISGGSVGSAPVDVIRGMAGLTVTE